MLIRNLFAILFLAVIANSAYASTWNKITDGINEPSVLKIAVHPNDLSVIFAATNNALYKSSDGGAHYKAVFQVPGQSSPNYIYIDESSVGNIYLATDAGLYATADAGNTWQRIYYSSDEESRRCLAVIRADETIYLGTGKGLFYKADGAARWSAVENELSRNPVYKIVSHGHFLYFATEDSLYALDKRTNSYAKIFTAGSSHILSDDEAVFDDEISSNQLIRFMAVTADTIYVATTRGIYLSADEGKKWQLLANPPFDLETLSAIVVLKKEKVLAGTRQGAFWFEEGKWTPIYRGMETNSVNDLTKDAREIVYAATESGVFYLSPGAKIAVSTSEVKAQVSEPTIQQVHKWAIDYAEVNPEKIKSWRSLARTKAFMPDLSVGFDRADGDLFHWDSGSNPDNLLKGRDFVDWDVSLSWDLSDLVWSTDQTTIDSRSKLMVELREDILDQVTRLYFERRRLQEELLSDEPLQGKPLREKRSRVEELTALLDAFTGGEFSQHHN